VSVIEDLMSAAIERSNLLRDKQAENIRDVSEASLEQISRSAIEVRVEQVGKAIAALKELTSPAPEKP
jgi:hypothetical protein